MTVLPSVICTICGKSVAPELCRLDEHSTPVHKGCYATKILKGEQQSSAIAAERAGFPGDGK